MGWDEFLFKRIYRISRDLFSDPKDSDSESKAVRLSEIRSRLSVLAKSLTGENIEIFPAEREGGFQGSIYFLPASYSKGRDSDSNLEYYIFRILYLSEQRRLGLNWRDGENRSRAESLRKSYEYHPEVMRSLGDRYPESKWLLESVEKTEKEFREKESRTIASEEEFSFLHGIWMSAPHSTPKNESQTPERIQTEKPEDAKIETELEAKPRERVESIEADKKAQEDYTLMHQFEKVETAEEFEGNWRDFDGSDQLSEQEEALNELDLRKTVRSNEPTHSVYRTDLFSGALSLEVGDFKGEEKAISYDEWDYKKRKYRKEYCKVFPKRIPDAEIGYSEEIFRENFSTLNSLRSRMNRFFHRKMQIKRQAYGEDLDLDASLQYYSDLYSGQTPSENLYVSQRKRLREVSVLILADMSLSTDSYVDNHRVLDVEKKSLLLFGQICSEFGDRFRIDSFYSNTRNHCDYLNIKNFEESWEKSRERIGLMEAKGYTRIGPAIRHAFSEIRKESSSRRWILLLTDGKPNDYDRYEGRYGIEDVKRAIKECEKEDVGVYALAVDRQAKDYLPAMLGKDSFRILPNPNQLPDALTDFFIRMIG
ncbi:hypothetical protein CH371_19305 [Leptospira wolffii]|uniref:VWFA domain-containing protein n=1 Tax=Leptospira wolffii TaxID=409998 RepID=A0A2M9Z756_9LEPT|nr:VWA domain-containing protein [Leptospira wolffii]PJZ64260.1 hypothetical protein CH371_19305 [Leptospira wolffii]